MNKIRQIDAIYQFSLLIFDKMTVIYLNYVILNEKYWKFINCQCLNYLIILRILKLFNSVR